MRMIGVGLLVALLAALGTLIAAREDKQDFSFIPAHQVEPKINSKRLPGKYRATLSINDTPISTLHKKLDFRIKNLGKQILVLELAPCSLRYFIRNESDSFIKASSDSDLACLLSVSVQKIAPGEEELVEAEFIKSDYLTEINRTSNLYANAILDLGDYYIRSNTIQFSIDKKGKIYTK